jgi:putative membrane protein
MTTMITSAAVLADGGSHGHWWIWIPFFWAFWLLVAVLLFWRFGPRSRLRRCTGGPGGTRDARAILAERYASGEINADEYRQRLETLG